MTNAIIMAADNTAADMIMQEAGYKIYNMIGDWFIAFPGYAERVVKRATNLANLAFGEDDSIHWTADDIVGVYIIATVYSADIDNTAAYLRNNINAAGELYRVIELNSRRTDGTDGLIMAIFGSNDLDWHYGWLKNHINIMHN